jgi:hypothetical protein
MTTTYSPSLKLALIGTGDQSGTWGQTTNTNLGTLLEQAITGVTAISLSGISSYTLTNYNGTSDDARNAILIFTGTPSAAPTITAPAQNKVYVVVNNTTQNLTMVASGGATSLVIPALSTGQAYCDASNVSGNGIGFYSAQTTAAGNWNVGGNLAVTGTSSFTGSAIMSTLIASSISATAINSATVSSSGVHIASSYTGAGTGLTGTAASLTAGVSQSIANAGGWNITPNGNKLYFNYNGTNIASLDSTGNFIALANITAYGTP